jgi:hypothetical protein
MLCIDLPCTGLPCISLDQEPLGLNQLSRHQALVMGRIAPQANPPRIMTF